VYQVSWRGDSGGGYHGGGRAVAMAEPGTATTGELRTILERAARYVPVRASPERHLKLDAAQPEASRRPLTAALFGPPSPSTTLVAAEGDDRAVDEGEPRSWKLRLGRAADGLRLDAAAAPRRPRTGPLTAGALGRQAPAEQVPTIGAAAGSPARPSRRCAETAPRGERPGLTPRRPAPPGRDSACYPAARDRPRCPDG